MLERFFKLKEHGTNVKTEIIAGITTFVTMAYILFVNPNMLSYGDKAIADGVFFATCLSAFVGTMLMALLAKLPFAQASGMGLNAFFAFTVMPAMARLAGNPEMPIVEQYHMALGIVFLSGLLFILITVLGAREAIVRAIPKCVKLSISGGIGLFLAFLGLKNAYIVLPSQATAVTLIDFSKITDPKATFITDFNPFGADAASIFTTVNAQFAIKTAIIAIFGLFLIGALYKLNVKGSILIGIIACTIVGIPLGVTNLDVSFGSFGDQFNNFMNVSFFKLDLATMFSGKNLISAISTVMILVISFSLVDMFDTIGTLLGTAKKANLLDENGNMIGMKKALLSDSIATTTGALLGTSTVTTYVESSAGIGEGGRTGLTSATTAVLFLLAVVCAPFVGVIPAAATAPALIFVGALMLSSIKDLDWSDISEAVPSFLTIALMPLTYSIANGIAFGLISYLVIKVFSGKFKDINFLTVIIAGLFLIRFFVAV